MESDYQQRLPWATITNHRLPYYLPWQSSYLLVPTFIPTSSNQQRQPLVTIDYLE
ncbi:hypothetical protein [Maribacter sp. ACAM166]|uniref:hypothetical protein n=1 Tax=Maribacter sp. ACAM166 TaxID=2508996 RepID=UPI0014859E04|nr:hypothetical protein [Maribacter sp. ACAM166]